MKLGFLKGFLWVFACILTWQVYADASSQNKSLTNTSRVHLDQSQSIFFEQFSQNTFSLQLLQNKNKFNINDIVLGGSAEMDWQNWHGDPIMESPVGSIYQNGHGLFFTQSTVDLMANTSEWSAIFLSLTDSYIGRNDADANTVYLPRAFLALGEPEKFPWYATLGLNSIPFGVFSGAGPWDTPLTALYFNPANSNQVSVGYDKNGLNAVVTGFNDQQNQQTDYAYSLYYNKDATNWGYSLGVGYLSDIKTNNTAPSLRLPHMFHQFSTTNVANLGAVWDFNSSVRYRKLTLMGEYLEGRDAIIGNQGDKPEAYSFVANYVQSIAGQDTTFGVGRSVALHLKDTAVPLTGYDNLASGFSGLQSAWSYTVSRPLSKNFVLGVDFQRAVMNPSVLLNLPQKHTYTTTIDLMMYL